MYYVAIILNCWRILQLLIYCSSAQCNFLNKHTKKKIIMIFFFNWNRITEYVFFFSGLSKSNVQRNYLFERAFQAIRERNPDLGYHLTHANKVYFNRELPLNSCIQLLLQDELAAVDFKNVEKVTNQINNWVNEKTRKKIPNLLPAGSLDSSTKMALVNAAYFKGNFTFTRF